MPLEAPVIRAVPGRSPRSLSRPPVASSVDTPDPPPGHALAILARVAGAADDGVSSDDLPRVPARGDCPPLAR